MSAFRSSCPLRSSLSGFRERNPTFFSRLGAFAIVLALAAVPTAGAGREPAVDVAGAARVLDGDTLEVDGQKVRLFGIDAPERTQTCNAFGTPYPCGIMAIAWMVEQTLGAKVVCQDGHVDQWRRLVAVCSVNGDDLAERIVGAGWALADPKYSDRYVGIETIARERRIGLWSGEFDAPREWRRGERTVGFDPVARR